MPDPTPRVPQISAAERTDEVRAMFAAIAGAGSMNIDEHYVLKTFAQHPALTKPFLDFNLHLLTTTTLPVRLRQLAILRTAWVKRARYMWASHLRLSLGVGLTEADFTAIKQGETARHWNEEERLLLHATDQLIAQSDLDDATWESLCAHLSQKQIMDLLFTIGAYVLLAMVFNTTRIQREPDLIELAERYGSPA